MLVEVQGGAGTLRPAVSQVVSATITYALVNNKLIFLYVYGGKDDIDWTRAQSKEWANAIVNTNAPPTIVRTDENSPDLNAFVDIKVKNVTFKLPSDWAVIADNGIVELRSKITSAISTKSTLHFQANVLNESGQPIATAQVYKWNNELDQAAILKLSQHDVDEYDSFLKNEFIRQTKLVNSSLSYWYKTKKIKVNGLYILASKYKRLDDAEGQFIVNVLRVFAGKNSFSLVVSYSEKSEIKNDLIQKIISNLKCNDCVYAVK